MGDWIKENKFEAGLLLVVLLIAIGAYVLGSGQGKKYQEHKDYYDAAANTKKTLESKRPFPSRENQAEYADEVADYAKVIDGLESALLKYRPAKFENITPPEFTDKLNAAISSAMSTFNDNNVKFPEDKWRLGFERYTESPPPADSTAYLSYQLDALSWLYGALAEAKASELLNVHRPELPVERGEPMGDDSKSSSRGSRGSRTQSSAGEPYHVLPVELTFRSKEPELRNFLGRVASNPDYFFVIRSLRFQNEKRDKGPSRDDVEFDKEEVGGSAFGDTFDIIPADDPGGEDPAPGAPDLELFPEEEEEPGFEPEAASGERILGQVLGKEELYVFLEIELILFTENLDGESGTTGDSN